MIDSKALGKPNPFDGQESKWHIWAVKLVIYLPSVYAELLRVLERCADQDGQIREADVSEAFDGDIDPVRLTEMEGQVQTV